MPKVTWTPNPLRTVVEPDDAEIELMRWKQRVEELKDDITSAATHFKRGETEKAMRAINIEPGDDMAVYNYLYNSRDGKGGLERRVDEMIDCYVRALRDVHVGDCTCVPASCAKCAAEEMMGIDTVKGMSKYVGHRIASAFAPNKNGDWQDTKSIDEAIAVLANFGPRDDWKGYEAHADRWMQQARDAHAWLSGYKTDHGF